MTSAIVQQSQRIGGNQGNAQRRGGGLTQVIEEEPSPAMRTTVPVPQVVKGQVIFINILESWGDLFYVGLNGLEVLDEHGQTIFVSTEAGTVNP